MVPAHQRLDAGDRAVGQRDLRLEIDLERLFRDGDAHVVLELLAVFEFPAQLFRKEGEGAAAQLLGGVKRQVGMDDQVLGIFRVDRIDGDAGAGAGQDRGAMEADRLVDPLHDAPRHHVDVFGVAGTLEDHHEFVAAEPHAEIRRPAGLAHALRRHDEHIVAGRMAERIVDLLEAVEVDLDDRHALVAAPRPLDQRIEVIGQEGPVVQAGQPVMDGDEGHRIARIDQFVGLAADDFRHRPEDEQGDQDDDGDGGEEQRCRAGRACWQGGCCGRVDALSERREALERRLGDGLVELRAFLAGQVAGAGPVDVEFGFERRDQAPAVGGQARAEIVEMVGLGEEHALDANPDRSAPATADRRRSARAAGRSSSRIRCWLASARRPAPA